jgi:hypothetical protein
MVLVIAGITLILRRVKDICLDLGIVFFLYGVGVFTGVMIAKNIAKVKLAEIQDIPQAFSTLPVTLVNDILSPLQIISLVCLILGIALIAMYFIYPRLRPAKTE